MVLVKWLLLMTTINSVFFVWGNERPLLQTLVCKADRQYHGSTTVTVEYILLFLSLQYFVFSNFFFKVFKFSLNFKSLQKQPFNSENWLRESFYVYCRQVGTKLKPVNAISRCSRSLAPYLNILKWQERNVCACGSCQIPQNPMSSSSTTMVAFICSSSQKYCLCWLK